MDGYLFCAYPEAMITEDLKRDPVARWYVQRGLSRVSRDSIRAQVQAVLNGWSSVASVAGVEAGSEDQADFVIKIVSSIDGRQGVLADCMLPGPRVQVMRLDDSELWTVHMGPDVPQQNIDLYRVLYHECGHFWGMGHAPQNSPNLMAPVYSRSIWTPQSWERQEMVKLYGPPKAPPSPTGNKGKIIIKGATTVEVSYVNADEISIPGYKITPIPPRLEE